MNKESAQNYLDNTKNKFMFKTISAAATAILFGILILVEEITGTAFSDFENIYFIISILLLIVTGAIVKTLKMTVSAFKWAFLLTPFTIVDIIFALAAAMFMVIVSLFLPFIPISLEALELYKKRADAKLYI